MRLPLSPLVRTSLAYDNSVYNCSGTELSFCTSIAVYFICPRHGYENLNNVGKFISKKIMEKKNVRKYTRNPVRKRTTTSDIKTKR